GTATRGRGFMEQNETSRWEPVKDLMAGARPVALGSMHAYHMAATPRRLLYSLSYYKFAAKMIGRRNEGTTEQGTGEQSAIRDPQSAIGDSGPRTQDSGLSVLDIGCGEGLGTWLLAAECGYAKGVDFDADLIETAKANWPAERCAFECVDVLKMKPQPYDAVVNFDVIEHILPEHAGDFLEAITANLTDYGIAVIGTPNITSRPYASAVTNAGHVNLYDGDRLEKEMREHFTQVFMFGANDEIVHTGFSPMAHYLIAMGCRPRR
ncbi:MAG: class I SAM-dependent methyltransferase, partial [Phycisphaeraceae bacterium]